MYNEYGELCTVVCVHDVHIVQCTVYIVHCTLHIRHHVRCAIACLLLNNTVGICYWSIETPAYCSRGRKITQRSRAKYSAPD